MNKQPSTTDWLQDQIIYISKAGAYDAIQPKLKELEDENKRLHEYISKLEDLLKSYRDLVALDNILLK